jgi:hypothetical protein
MPATLSWNEVRDRAVRFSRDWAGETREEAEAKSFWDAFFEVFGKSRRTVATFEEPVKNIKGQYGYIDLFWRGKLIVEHKSAGKDLSKAHTQAVNYIQDLITDGRDIEAPRYILVSDFARFFQTLDTPPERRSPHLDEDLNAFPYVNGELFREPLPMADFKIVGPCGNGFGFPGF